MILTEIEKQIQKNQQNGFLYPRYKDFCFSNIPSTILHLLGLRKKTPLSPILSKANLTSKTPQKVILFLLDGFGYKQWLKHTNKYELLNHFTKKGTVSPLTTVFPSTTSAALTTIHSGLTPQEHGLPEWWVYFQELDKIITTLPFTPMGEKTPDKLLDSGVNPKILFKGKTIHETLQKSKIPSFVFLRNTYAKSAYSKTIHKGSKITSFINLPDLLINLKDKIAKTPGPAYFYVYWDALDSIAHTYGPHTKQYLAELKAFFHLLQKEFIEKLPSSAAEIPLILTADHGQINIDPKKTIYLNQYPKVTDNLALGPNGNKILPWGSPRDVFLAIKPEKLAEVFKFLTRTFQNKATVIKSKTALKQGLFGQEDLHKEFSNRIGNILILPHGNSTVWYKHPQTEKLNLLGLHGGLTAEEMLIPFAIAKAGKLQQNP